METRFSKSFKDIEEIKNEFILSNKILLKRSEQRNKKYKSQAKRSNCKNCLEPILNSQVDLFNHGVGYKICRNCSHLNGEYLETKEYTSFLYENNAESNYSSNYINNYEKRVLKIYLPKAEYLTNSLKTFCSIDKFELNDFGCGAGHFVNALKSMNITSFGFDISRELLNVAENYWKYKYKENCKSIFFSVNSEEELLENICKSTTEVISLIGVLEHLMNPQKVFQSFIKSNSKYMFFSVPLFSLSVFFENVLRKSYPRQLSGGHTHLYTHESINYICEKFNLVKICQWHFGSDIFDLKRALFIHLTENNSSNYARDILMNKFLNVELLDDLQSSIDKNFAGSETHILISKS